MRESYIIVKSWSKVLGALCCELESELPYSVIGVRYCDRVVQCCFLFN